MSNKKCDVICDGMTREEERKGVFEANLISTLKKSINVIYHINSLKTENHMILLIDVEKQSTKSNTH